MLAQNYSEMPEKPTSQRSKSQGMIVICGPTATGKSGLAMAIAQRLPSVILSADSRQVYRAFDIGTAKPSLSDRQQVLHGLLDLCDPTKTLTVADYQSTAQQLIHACHGRSGLNLENVAWDWHPDQLVTGLMPTPPFTPLLVGGTGLYIKSVVRGLRIPRVAPQAELRSHLQQLGQAQCYAMLQQVDPAAAAKIHGNDPVRTIRALEVFYVTGRPITVQQGESPPDYPILQIGLDCQEGDGETDPLTQRITLRTQQMVKAGFVEEVRHLNQRYGTDLPLLKTLGYQEMQPYLAGDCALEEAIAQIILHTRQFAKRQRTWFRAIPEIEWFDADHPDLIEQVWRRIQAFEMANIDKK